MGDKEKMEELVKIYSAQDHMTGKMAMELLKNAGIRCFAKEPGNGTYMNVYMGYSVFGEDLYVNGEDEKQAREILSVIEEQAVETEEEEFQVPWYRNRHILAWILIGLVVLGWILLGGLTQLSNLGYI